MRGVGTASCPHIMLLVSKQKTQWMTVSDMSASFDLACDVAGARQRNPNFPNTQCRMVVHKNVGICPHCCKSYVWQSRNRHVVNVLQHTAT